jgi:hypothetical protein
VGTLQALTHDGAGGNFIDTANHYPGGTSERVVGVPIVGALTLQEAREPGLSCQQMRGSSAPASRSRARSVL